MATDYTAMRAAAEARKTLPERLRNEADFDREAAPTVAALLDEARAEIDRLNAVIDQARRDAIEEQREAQRDARAAVAEARWQERQGDDYGSY